MLTYVKVIWGFLLCESSCEGLHQLEHQGCNCVHSINGFLPTKQGNISFKYSFHFQLLTLIEDSPIHTLRRIEGWRTEHDTHISNGMGKIRNQSQQRVTRSCKHGNDLLGASTA
jgi:hypothetical protein